MNHTNDIYVNNIENNSNSEPTPEVLYDTPKVFKSKWECFDIFLKSELLFLIIAFSLIYTPNFIFSLKPLPVFSQRNNQSQKRVFAPVDAKTIVKLTNQVRQESEIPLLELNNKLSKAAQKRAHDMVTNNYFAHTSPHGKYFTWWLENEDYDYEWSGENLARNFNTSQQVIKAWINSEAHYNNLVNPNYNQIGIGVARNPRNNQLIVVQLFGSEKEYLDTIE